MILEAKYPVGLSLLSRNPCPFPTIYSLDSLQYMPYDHAAHSDLTFSHSLNTTWKYFDILHELY